MIAATAFRSLWRSEDGFILPIVLLLFAIGMLLIAPTLGHGYTSLLASTTTESKAQELHAADSGIEEALHWLTRSRAQDGTYVSDNWATGPWVRSSPYVLNEKYVYVTIEPYESEEQDNLYLITSRAEDPEGGGSTVLALVYAVPYVTILEGDQHLVDDYPDDLAVIGNLDIETANTTITGTVTVDGYLTLGEGVEIIGDVNATGDVTLGQSASIQCEVLCTGGNLVLGQSGVVLPPASDVDAEIHFLNPEGSLLTFANSATVTGNIHSVGDLQIDMVSPLNMITGDIIVDGDLTINIYAGSASTPYSIDGDLYATGNVTIRVDSKHAKILGNLYYYDDQDYLRLGTMEATWPTPYTCTEATCMLPEPERQCPTFPENDADIQIWEIS